MNQTLKNPLFQPLALPGAGPEKKLQPTFAQTMSSAFGLENDVVNLYDYTTRPVFAPDPAFKFQDAFKAKKLPLEWMPLLAPAQSQQEFDATLGRVQKEYQDKAVLAASGWTGTVTALGAGILSPTVFIPFTGQARGAMGVAQMLGLAAAGATAQNAALFFNQETRTEAELYTGIAMDTLLMGMMGGAYFGLSKAGRAQLGLDMKFNEKRVTVPQGPMDVPGSAEVTLRVENPDAAEVKRVVREEKIRDPEMVREMMDEAGAGPVPLKDKALEIGEIKRTTTKDPEVQLQYGKSYLEAPIAEGVTARFVKVPAGSGGKWFVGGEYAITLHTADGVEISIPQAKATTHRLNGNTGVYKEAELKAAIAEGKLDDQLYEMLEAADEPRMVPNTVKEAIPNSSRSVDAQAVGAAPSSVRNTLGAKRAPNRARQIALDTLGKLSPSYRMLTNRFFPSLRNGIAKLDNSGIQQAGLDRMEPSANGGPVIERIRGYDPAISEFAQALDRNFYNYMYDGAPMGRFDSAAFAQIRSQFGKGVPGKMNWEEYKAAVFDALNTGEIPAEIADSVQAFKEFFETYTKRQKQYLEEFAARGLDVEPLFKELDSDELGEGVAGYAHHIFDQNKLMQDFSTFLDDFSKAYERQLTEAFGKAKLRYGKRKAKLEFEQLVSGLPPDELRQRLEVTESDLEFIEEMPEYQDLRAQRLEINRQVRDGELTKENGKQALKDLLNNQPESMQAVLAERKQLMSVAKSLRKFGGDATESIAKLRAEVDKADELISGMFREQLPKIAKADLEIGKAQKQGDKALAAVTKDLEKVVKGLNARRATMVKLLNSKRNNTSSRLKVAEQLEALKVKYDGMLERLSAVNGQQVALDERLRELQLIREDAIADANRLVRGRVAKVEDLEDKLDAAIAKPLTPEDRARMQAQIGEEMWQLESDFQSTWGRRGDQSGDSVATDTPDFREKALEMATMLHQKLTNSEVELSPAYHALRQDARGAELLRVMKIPYDMKNKWLIKDVELVSRAYDRVMAPDLEIWRAFDGSVNAKSLLGEMQMEVTDHMTRIGTAKFVKLPKGWVDKAAKFNERVKKRLAEAGDAEDIYLDEKNFSDTGGDGFVPMTDELRSQLGQAVADAAKQFTEDLDVAIQRLRNTRGVPKDGSSMWWRTGKFVKNMNVMTMMGGVLVSSVADVARPVWQHGISRTFNAGWKPFINKLNPQAKEFRLKSKEINRQIGLNLEPMLNSRAQGVFDLAEDTIGRTKLEQAANVGANKMGLIALYDFWTAGMKTIAGNVTHATMAEYVPKVAAAWRQNSGAIMEGDLLQMQTYLRNLGLRDTDIHRIALQMEKPDGVEIFSNGGVLPNLGKWDDPSAYQAYQAAVLSEVNKLIVTPGLERPNVVDENMAYSMLFQFKSFVFASNSRMAMSGLQGNDPYLMQGIAFSLAFGALSYYTYAMTVGGKTLAEANEGNADKWIWESVKRTGLLGALSIGTDVGGAIPLLNGSETPSMFKRPSGLLGVLLGPTYSQADKMAEFITKMDDPEARERNLRILRQVWVPYQNHTLFRQLFDRAEQALAGS